MEYLLLQQNDPFYYILLSILSAKILINTPAVDLLIPLPAPQICQK